MHLVKNEIAIYTKLVKHDNLIESTTLLLQTDPRITFFTRCNKDLSLSFGLSILSKFMSMTSFQCLHLGQ